MVSDSSEVAEGCEQTTKVRMHITEVTNANQDVGSVAEAGAPNVLAHVKGKVD